MQPIDLIDHPEGGRFREVFRSAARVTTGAGESRSALTHIYFELRRGEVSRFHRVRSDEVWNLYQGDGLRLITLGWQRERTDHNGAVGGGPVLLLRGAGRPLAGGGTDRRWRAGGLLGGAGV